MARRMLIDASHPEETRVVVVDGTELDRIRFRDGVPQAAQGQHLPRQGHPHRAVAAGGVRRVWRQPPRLPGLLGNPSRLLPDPGRRPRKADRRAAAPHAGRGPEPPAATGRPDATSTTRARKRTRPKSTEAARLRQQRSEQAESAGRSHRMPKSRSEGSAPTRRQPRSACRTRSAPSARRS